jgi:hypothetical protein
MTPQLAECGSFGMPTSAYSYVRLIWCPLHNLAHYVHTLDSSMVTCLRRIIDLPSRCGQQCIQEGWFSQHEPAQVLRIGKLTTSING